MKKNTKKSAEGFILRGTTGQLNKKNQYLAVFLDTCFLWLYLTGGFGFLASAFALSVSWSVMLVGFFLVAGILSFLAYESAKVKKFGILTCLMFTIVLGLLFHKGLLSGLNLILNQSIDVLGRTFPYMWPEYAVTVSEDAYPWTLALTCVWCSVFVGFLGQYILKSGNRLLLSMHFVLIFLLQMIMKALPSLFWNVFVVMTWIAFWMRSHSEKLPAGRQRMASAGIFVLIAVCICVFYGILQIVWPASNYEKNETVETWKEHILTELESIRYEGSSQALPDGNFENLTSFETSETPVLKVTMSTPESYYLRGFTGSVYTGTGWSMGEREARWEYRDLFYWLHDGGYYGQETLSQAAKALGDGTDLEENLISIENINGNSKYYYVPYELCSANILSDLPFDSTLLGDENLVADVFVKHGLTGNRSYAYTALPNQITKYPSFASRLLDEDSFTDDEKTYQKLESYYNQFVYENYVEISGSMRGLLQELLGETNISENEKHTDYAEAKQNILYVLNSTCTYNETLTENWNGSDFVVDFLNKSKSGYSVHYASAATLMFRYYGIPARYVEGYLITPEDAKQMNANEAYVLDETHAHAWTEYYQDGVGWVPFETTPSYLNIMPKAEEYQDISGTVSGGNSEQDLPEEESEDEETPEETFGWLMVIEILLLLGIGLFLLLLISFIVYVIVQRQKSKKAKKLFDSENKREAVRSLFSYTMNILAVAGLPIKNTSLYRYSVPMEKMFDEDVRHRYEEVVAIRQEAVYSDHEITEEQRQVLVNFKDMIWKRVYEGSGWVQKFQLKYIYFL